MAYVATSPFRFGLELEMHGILLSFRRRGTDVFWPLPADGRDLEKTMIGLNTILLPFDATNYLRADSKINWESNWGFRAVGDAFTQTPVKDKDVGACILELATAANQVDDHGYWTSSRLCAKEFVNTMRMYSTNTVLVGGPNDYFQDGQRRWYPLQKFLVDYNVRIEALPNRPGFIKDRFKLKQSLGLDRLATGEYPTVPEIWDAYVTCSKDPLDQWCDVQVNYQMSLRTLDTNQDAWIRLWNSMWVEKTSGILIDPPNGEIIPVRAVARESIYKTQTYAALWRLARHLAHANYAPPPPADGVTDPLVSALITYVLAVGAITIPGPEEIGSSTTKNAFPQLPKTSPASIAYALQVLRPGITPFFHQLAAPGLPDVPSMTRARNDTTNSLRNLAVLAAPIGGAGVPNIPATGPVAALPAYNTDDRLIRGDILPVFDNTWSGSFNPALAPDDTNANGFQTTGPFYCRWAAEVNSGMRAVTFAHGGQNDIKMLFESRYGRSLLNIGFNPYVTDPLFHRSYLSLVNLLCTAPEINAVTPAITIDFPDTPGLRQNFAGGVH